MQKVGKFVMVTPRAVSPAGTKPRIHAPLGAISVLAEVLRLGFEAVLLDLAAEGLKRQILDSGYNPVTEEDLDGMQYWKTGLRNEEAVACLTAHEPTVIGISCSTLVDRGETARIAKAIKTAFPNIPIILGGHEASKWYVDILGCGEYLADAIPEVDFVVVGPGQPVIGQLLRYLSGKSYYIPNGVAWQENGEIRLSGNVDFQPDLFPTPAYELLPQVTVEGRGKPMDVYSYIGNPHAGRVATILGVEQRISYLPLLTSYGCGFNCSFCDTEKSLLRYGVENVLGVISRFHDHYGIDYIDFMDNNFGGGNEQSQSTAFAILEEVSKSGHQIGFSNGLTFESMFRDDFRLLRRFAENGNVRHIAFPCENGNDRVLKMIRKPHNLPVIRKVMEFARENLQMTNREGFFIGGFPETDGHPAESPDEVRQTYRFMEECLKTGMLHQAIFLTLSPVTREYRLAWRKLYPHSPFEHCLFSRKTGVWPYPNSLLDEIHQEVKQMNAILGRSVTRQL